MLRGLYCLIAYCLLSLIYLVILLNFEFYLLLFILVCLQFFFHFFFSLQLIRILMPCADPEALQMLTEMTPSIFQSLNHPIDTVYQIDNVH